MNILLIISLVLSLSICAESINLNNHARKSTSNFRRIGLNLLALAAVL